MGVKCGGGSFSASPPRLFLLHLPSQQPTRFSNRCLQMIGRCWPHLRALGVGGAGCGVQGLASLGRQLSSDGTREGDLAGGRVYP